ncbi:hypothetical protein Tco_0009196 [Tanacetum coccineum]
MWNQFRQYARQNAGYQNEYNAVQNVRNQVIQDAVQNQGVQNIGNQNGQIGGNQISVYNCQRNWVILLGILYSQTNEGMAAYLSAHLLMLKRKKHRIQLQAKEFDLMADVADLDNIEEVNAKCILMAKLQQASTSISGLIPDNSSHVEQEGGTVDQHPATVEETRAYFESLYNNLALEVEKKNQSANVSKSANQKKHKAQVWKPKNIGSKERFASPKPSKPRSCLRWSPTGRFFDLQGKIITSSESESQSDFSKGDNAFTSNPQEPINKRFPSSNFSMTGCQKWFDTLLIPLLSEYNLEDKEDHGDNECDT